MLKQSPQRDTRIVYGVGCTWWDSIYNVGHTTPMNGHALPCCPHCGSLLMELRDEATWWKGVDQHEAKGNPGYRKMIEWLRGRCFPNYGIAKIAYAAAMTK